MNYEIIGIGNPLLDMTVSIDEIILEQNNLTKGHMVLLDEEAFLKLLNSFDKENVMEGLGGSVPNTLASAHSLGISTLYLGAIGNDKYGQEYARLTEESGLGCGFVSHNLPQGTCLVLITPDGERTFAVFLGAATQFTKADLNEEAIKNAKILHIEGYQLDTPNQVEAITYAMNLAKENNVLVSMDLADPHLIKRHKELITNIVRDFVDIVFVNELEAKEFTNLIEEEALSYLSKLCKYSIVKLGEKGSLISFENVVEKIDINKVQVVNTNGAGDAYAGAFLGSLIKNWDLKKCGKVAAYISSQVVASPYSRIMKNMELEIDLYFSN